MGIWLTTLSTVVAIAAGMFTVRDSIWKPEPEARPASGTSPASPKADTARVDAYQDGIAGVCRQLSSDERARAADARTSSRQLARADTGYEQAEALLRVATRIKDRSLSSLARFEGLKTPGALKGTRFTVVRAWDRTIEVLQAHEGRLRNAETYGDLVAVARRSNAKQATVDRDWGRITSGISKLGDTSCDRLRLSTPPIRLRAPVAPATGRAQTSGNRRAIASVSLEVASDPDTPLGPAFAHTPHARLPRDFDPRDVPDPPDDIAPKASVSPSPSTSVAPSPGGSPSASPEPSPSASPTP